MERNGQNITAAVKNILRPVAVMVVDINDRDFPLATQLLRRQSGIVEIAKAAKGTVLCPVTIIVCF